MYPQETPVPTEELLQAVAHPRRRQVLRYLHENGIETTTAGKLAAAISATTDDESPTDRETLQIELQHNHLPRLADAGLVEFDPRNATVRYDSPEPVGKLVEFIATELE